MPGMKYPIGCRVITSHAFSSPSRRSKVAAYRESSTGHWFYELADGGWFLEHELESDEIIFRSAQQIQRQTSQDQ